MFKIIGADQKQYGPVTTEQLRRWILAGIALSAGFLLFLIYFLAVVRPSALAKARDPARTIYCTINMKQLVRANLMYAHDHNGRLPQASGWCDSILTNISGARLIPGMPPVAVRDPAQTNVSGAQQVFLCPAGERGARCHYAFNAKLSSVEDKAIRNPMLTVMLFESEGGWNANGGPELLLRRPRHIGGIMISFADGAVQVVRLTHLDKLVWEP